MKLIKAIIILLAIILIGAFSFALTYRSGIILDCIGIHIESPLTRRIQVPDDYSKIDLNNNGIADVIDIVNAARQEVQQKTKYQDGYYAGGYPPVDEGVCTDVIWRGFLGANINLKELIDQDIADNVLLYPGVNGKPEPNIDFRRVQNQNVFFKRYAHSLVIELIPGDIDNLRQWQPGDIVVFLDGFEHVAIVSDKRAKDGTPYIIHNMPPFAVETKLKSVSTSIAGHYRWKFE